MEVGERMGLDDFVEERSGDITGWVTFQGGFDLLLEFAPKMTLQKMQQKCTRTRYKKHVPVEEVDTDLLTDEMVKLVKDWRLTREAAYRLFNIKKGIDLPDPVPFTVGGVKAAIRNLYGFDTFLVDKVTDIEALRQGRLDLEKKT